jgi:hypothetical protein
VLLFTAVVLGWLAVALFIVTIVRVAAVTDARREAQIAEWLSRRRLAERRAADGAHTERIPPELRRWLNGTARWRSST